MIDQQSRVYEFLDKDLHLSSNQSRVTAGKDIASVEKHSNLLQKDLWAKPTLKPSVEEHSTLMEKDLWTKPVLKPNVPRFNARMGL